METGRVSELFSALGNPTRLKIIDLISKTNRPLHIKAVAQVLKKDYATVYRHVKVMENSNLVGIHEVGRSRVLYLKKADLLNECIRIVKKML